MWVKDNEEESSVIDFCPGTTEFKSDNTVEGVGDNDDDDICGNSESRALRTYEITLDDSNVIRGDIGTGEGGEEPSLAMVTNQEYIYYAKGALNMYALQEQIGEKNVNVAIKKFIKDWNSIDGKLKTATKRYATSDDLLGYFRNETPENLKQIISELFESVEEVTIE